MFFLGKKSLNKSWKVHPSLFACVALAIADCEVDFTVSEGVREKKRQQKLVAMGRSWTMDSQHLIQPTGYSHAIDLVPLENGQPAWDKCYLVKEAMFRAARKLGVTLRWGGDWNQNGSSQDEKQRGSYDGPHFEILGV